MKFNNKPIRNKMCLFHFLIDGESCFFVVSFFVKIVYIYPLFYKCAYTALNIEERFNMKTKIRGKRIPMTP